VVAAFRDVCVASRERWPGFTYVVITNLTETGGAIIGESNQLRNIRVEFQMFNATLENGLNLTGNKHYIGRDANPISAAYKVLNDPDWGIATNDVNFTNFQTVADTCYTELLATRGQRDGSVCNPRGDREAY
jgi:hypothetical protein